MILMYFLLIISMFSISFAPQSEEHQADIGEPLILINVGVEYNLPICMYQRHHEYRYTTHENHFPYFFCPPKIPLTGEHKNCLMPFHSKQEECESRVEPIITKVMNDSGNAQAKCSNLTGLLYEFTFYPCKKETRLLGGTTGRIYALPPPIMYDICYNHDKEQILWISHKLHSPLLLENRHLEVDRKVEYELSTNDFGLFNNRFQILKKLYSEELEKGEMKLQHIVPPEHMAFRVWKRSAYHNINTLLVLKQTAQILKHVDQFIKEQAVKLLSEIRIIDSFLFSNTGDVKIWYKSVYTRSFTSAILIIVHNSLQEPTDEDKLCTESICLKYGWGDIILENFGSYIYCCEINKKTAGSLRLQPVKHAINLKSKWRKLFKSSHHRREFWC